MWIKQLYIHHCCQIFWYIQHTKKGKSIPNYYNIYQMSIKNTKWLQNRPSVHTIYQHLSLQDTPKFTQTWIFGLKIYHLATLTYPCRNGLIRSSADAYLPLFANVALSFPSCSHRNGTRQNEFFRHLFFILHNNCFFSPAKWQLTQSDVSQTCGSSKDARHRVTQLVFSRVARWFILRPKIPI
jgi:hypothetical protein